MNNLIWIEAGLIVLSVAAIILAIMKQKDYVPKQIRLGISDLKKVSPYVWVAIGIVLITAVFTVVKVKDMLRLLADRNYREIPSGAGSHRQFLGPNGERPTVAGRPNEEMKTKTVARVLTQMNLPTNYLN
jgi:predicted RNA binding protein YcfA (HicA-like mRNA interferase family)